MQKNKFIPREFFLLGRSTWATWLLKALVAAGLLFYLVRAINLADIIDAIQNASHGFLIAAFVLSLVNITVQCLRWRLFVSTDVPNITFFRCLSSLLGGFAIGLITPGRIGEIGRIFLLKVPSRIRLAGLHVLDKMYTFGAIALSGPLLLFLFPGFRSVVPESLTMGIGILVGILPLIYLWFAIDPRVLKSLFYGIQIAFRSKPKIAKVIEAFDGLTIYHTSRALILTLIQLGIILTQFFLITLSFQPVRWLVAAHTYSVVLFIKTALPVSLGSLGIGEWAAVSLYHRYGIADTTAFSSSLLLFGMNVLLPALVGLIILINARPQSVKKTVSKDGGETE
ncbi:MAG: lysylphosphatidylglycerol synthase transmembrane domain-containing protein [Candidatus Electryonea clarkiae]|nr:lysylphosphatidylglycerol synthase transmembrane domain-containing protein [Candidatus Electryonea clarkiae]MDP8286067.1 lysylphosphatidylglycerol synthase transmembrane domain-containing protein [Candidatus Electryonea clarkiae]